MSQRTTLVAGAVAAAAWWFKKRQSDERRDRSSSIAYDDEDALFRAMKTDAVAAAIGAVKHSDGEPARSTWTSSSSAIDVSILLTSSFPMSSPMNGFS